MNSKLYRALKDVTQYDRLDYVRKLSTMEFAELQCAKNRARKLLREYEEAQEYYETSVDAEDGV